MDTDSTDDSNKRSRSRGGEQIEPFGKSRKTTRTPTKQRKRNKGNRYEQRESRKEIELLNQENKALKLKCDRIEKNENIRKEQSNAQKKMKHLETEKRENDVVMYGLKINTSNTRDLTNAIRITNFMDKTLEVQMQVKAARKLGKKTYLIELSTAEDKERITQNKYKLKNKTNDRIYINHDLSEREKNNAKGNKAEGTEREEKQKPVKIADSKLTIQNEE
ncbi:hypothetical protein ILUMI_21456 [Ignelater luminosus]|uniref:Uncharacterized protein n=1 Tax=Ignelater luminosus TaxID=2038154 RepID=A0A8K0FXY3_IGNLU|nr:hypothetical protein ILUMI_21456 [Ignelater luminosus]